MSRYGLACPRITNILRYGSSLPAICIRVELLLVRGRAHQQRMVV